MKKTLLVICGVAIVAGAGALILGATDAIVPKHGYITALLCAAYVGWYYWKGNKLGK